MIMMMMMMMMMMMVMMTQLSGRSHKSLRQCAPLRDCTRLAFEGAGVPRHLAGGDGGC